jgi:hypothetical protein
LSFKHILSFKFNQGVHKNNVQLVISPNTNILHYTNTSYFVASRNQQFKSYNHKKTA